jgi:NAD(P)H-dependent FMN reductase
VETADEARRRSAALEGANLSEENEVRVIGLCGSLRPGSFTLRTLQIALGGAEELGASTRLVDLRDYDLVFCDGNRNEDEYPEDVFRLRREVAEADGIILGTPEYHGGCSGVLKNALDLMGFEQFEGKMVGLVGVAGGQQGAVNACNSLRGICRHLHAWVVPEQASVAMASKAFEDDGGLKDSKLEDRIKNVGRQVARFAFLHGSDQAMDFVRAWEEAPVNPGGGAEE